MAPANVALIDIHAANIEVREREKQAVTEQCAALCGARSTNAFLNAVEWWQDRMAEIDRRGFCLACGGALVNESRCVKCGRDNS